MSAALFCLSDSAVALGLVLPLGVSVCCEKRGKAKIRSSPRKRRRMRMAASIVGHSHYHCANGTAGQKSGAVTPITLLPSKIPAGSRTFAGKDEGKPICKQPRPLSCQSNQTEHSVESWMADAVVL